MARLYADEHIPVQVIYRLRRLGHDVLTVKETNQDKYGDGVDDDQVLAFATLDKRAVLTENCADFYALHKSYPGHRGIIASKRFDNWREQAKLIDGAIKAVLNKHSTLNSQFIRIPYVEEDPSRPVPLKKSKPPR